MCGLTTAEALLTEGRSAVNMLLDQILGFPYLISLFCWFVQRLADPDACFKSFAWARTMFRRSPVNY